MLKDALFALGILIAISGWLLDAVSPESWIGHVVAPGYAPAMAGYRSLSRGRAISKHDRGFGELLEFATIEAPKIDRSQIDALHLGGLGIETAGISTHFELLGRGVHAESSCCPPGLLRASVSHAVLPLRSDSFILGHLGY